MRHLIILVVIFISASAFSQTNVDSVFTPTPTASIVVQKVDTVQIARIDDIEKSLTAFYTYNRRSHNLIFLSMGMSLVSVLLANGDNTTAAGVISIAGGVVGIIGTVIYLDSYKFLNFKPKRKEIRGMTYY